MHMCDMTHSYVWQDSFICVTRHIPYSSSLGVVTLQHTATHGKTLQQTATHCCNTLQYTQSLFDFWGVVCWDSFDSLCITLQHTATHCKTLQHTHSVFDLLPQGVLRGSFDSLCNSLQHTTATHCNTLIPHLISLLGVASETPAVSCTTLHHTASHCNNYCNTLQHTAAHCSTLQHTATHCCNTFVPYLISSWGVCWETPNVSCSSATWPISASCFWGAHV